MTATGSGREPRFSDDRQWWWDGTQWLPASKAPVPPPPPTQAPVAPPAPSSPASVPPLPASPTSSSRFPRWLVIVAAILFLPVTLGILIWRTKWSMRTKWVLTGALAVVVVFGALVAGDLPSQTTSSNPQIASATSRPRPSPSPVATPSPSPSPVATPTPSPSPVATPSPSPVAKPSPTPVASLLVRSNVYLGVFIPLGELGSQGHPILIGATSIAQANIIAAALIAVYPGVYISVPYSPASSWFDQPPVCTEVISDAADVGTYNDGAPSPVWGEPNQSDARAFCDAWAS